MKIYLWQDDREWGPFTKEEIFLKLKTKEIALEAFARLETDTAWRTLNEVLVFSPLVSLRPKTPSPAQSLPSLFPKPYERRAAHPSPKAASRKVAPAGRGGLGVFQGTMGFALLLGLGVLAFGWLSRPSVHPANQSADRSNWNAGERPDADAAPGLENDKAFPSTDNENAAGVSRSVPNAAPFADESPSSVAAVGQNPSETLVEAPSLPTREVVPPVENDEGNALRADRDPAPQQELRSSVPPSEARQTQALRPLPEPRAADFFKIHAIKIVKKVPQGLEGVWLQVGANRINWKAPVFVPYIEVTVQTLEQYESKNTFLRLHVFDRDKKLVQTLEEPAIAWRNRVRGYTVPPLYPEGQRERVFFALPETFDPSSNSMLVLFGDQKSAIARIYPPTVSTFGLDFPERSLVELKVNAEIQREAAINPVIETVVETLNPKQPIMTLFMRMPIGLKDAKQARGVLAMCLLANNVEQIRTMLQKMDRGEDDRILADLKKAMGVFEKRVGPEIASVFKSRLATRKPADDALLVEDMGLALKSLPVVPEDKQLANCRALVGQLGGRVYQNNMVKFAERHQLAILAWGARRLWDPKLSFDEQTRKMNREMDETFDDVAKAWEKGVDRISKQYGFPNRNFLLTGHSGAAQYACRLALRKPDRFLAVHVHIPSSFDRPTPEANQVLWLLTTGEKEGGYPAAKRFFNDCKALGYPMVFKAIPGLGHAGSRISDGLGLEFFEYALTLKDQREQLALADQKIAVPQAVGQPEPWPSSFKTPKSVGDLLNQDIFPNEEADIVPPEFQVALPTDSIAEAWMK